MASVAPSAHAAVLRIAIGLSAVNRTVATALARPPSDRSVPTILLVVGTDRREGLSPSRRTEGDTLVTGPRADTILLVAVHPTDERIDAIGVPRDLAVDLVDCGPQSLSTLLDWGGASLLVQHTAAVLDVPIHHYVEVDFDGFVALVDAVGGIPIEVPDRFVDPQVGLDLTGGPHLLDGRTALAFTRSRTNVISVSGRPDTVHLGDRGRMARIPLLTEAFAGRFTGDLSIRRAGRVLRAVRNQVVVDEFLTGRHAKMLADAVVRSQFVYSVLEPQIPIADSFQDSPFPPYQPSGTIPVGLDPGRAATILGPLRARVPPKGEGELME